MGGSRVLLHSRSELALDAPAGSPDHWASGALLLRSVRALLKAFARGYSQEAATRPAVPTLIDAAPRPLAARPKPSVTAGDRATKEHRTMCLIRFPI